MLELRARGADVRGYVHDLEEWMIRTLGRFNVRGERREGRVGIWVDRGGGREEKIGAIGVRHLHWVSFHGFPLNLAPEPDQFAGLVPSLLPPPHPPPPPPPPPPV